MTEPSAGTHSEFPSDERAARRAKARQFGRTIFLRLVIFCAFALATAYAINVGLVLRRWTWDSTSTIHFFPDVNNGYYWGSEGNRPKNNPRGFLNVYDLIAANAPQTDDNAADYRLDYAPLRLLLMTRWVAWTQTNYPALADRARRASAGGSNPTPWDTQYDFFSYTLRFNTGMELLSMAGIFLLTRHWAIRKRRLADHASRDPTLSRRGRFVRWLESPGAFRGWLPGFFAAMFFWFNPAVLLSAHAWPTWDMWIIPFFVWAVYFASLDCWLIAGLVIAVGAMFKGQQLFVAPMFILWPIFLGQPGKALRWTVGLVFGIAVIALPWLVTFVPGGVTRTTIPADRMLDRPAIVWIAGVAVASLVLPTILQCRWLSRGLSARISAMMWAGLGLLVISLVAWPFMLPANRGYLCIGLLMAAVVLTGTAFLSMRQRLVVAAGAVGTSLLLCTLLFQGNLNWLYIGWGYGTRHYPHMTQGVSDNLAGILHERFGWQEITEPVFTIDAHPLRLWSTQTTLFDQPTTVTIRQLLCGIYVVTFLVSVVGVALQYRRNDPRFLVAIAAPWVMFFAFLPQIHERYLLYAVGVGCCFTAVSWGTTLINLLLTGLTVIMPLQVMLGSAYRNGYIGDFGRDISPTFENSLSRFIQNTYPDAGWAVLLCAAIFLYLALVPTPSLRRSR